MCLRGAFIGLLSAVLLSASGRAQQSSFDPTMAQDLAHRNPAIHWPSGYDPVTAGSFAHNELVIPVSCSQIFARLADAEAWPTWLVFATDVQVPAHRSLQMGTTFQWRIFGKPIDSTVDVYEPGRQIGWLNSPSHYYQAWLFQPVATGCRVTTEEIGVGESAARARAAGDTRTHRAHDLWLASLRWIALGGTALR